MYLTNTDFGERHNNLTVRLNAFYVDVGVTHLQPCCWQTTHTQAPFGRPPVPPAAYRNLVAVMILVAIYVYIALDICFPADINPPPPPPPPVQGRIQKIVCVVNNNQNN